MADFDDFLETLKKVAAVLREADVPFLLGGGLAAWARGGPESDHDLDLMVKPGDAEPAVSGSWPVALRAVRAWLTPWSAPTRCWRSWSPAPPPRQLQRLLDALAGGQPLHLYLPP